MEKEYIFNMDTSENRGKLVIIKASNLRNALKKLLDMKEGEYWIEEINESLKNTSDFEMQDCFAKSIKKKFLKIVLVNFPMADIQKHIDDIREKISKIESEETEVENFVDCLRFKIKFNKEVTIEKENEIIKEIEEIIKGVVPKVLIESLEIKRFFPFSSGSFDTPIPEEIEKTLYITVREK